MPTKTLAIAGVRALTPSGWADDAVIVVDGDRIAGVVGTVPPGAEEVRADGLLALPGIVDIHGDAFERSLQPRTGVRFPVAGVVAEMERQLTSAGITTFFWSITDSYEPGLRGRETLRTLLASVPWQDVDRPVDHRLHVRHEWLATDGHDELLSLVSSGLVDLLSVNDHSPGVAPPHHMARIAEGFRGRAGLTVDEAMKLLASLEDRREQGDEQIAELVHVARLAGVPLASHDDADDDALARSLGWGVAVVEFPGSLPLAAAARAGGAAVVMGAPNAVRGTSHVGFPTVAEAAAGGVVDVVCSDYHLPSLFLAPFRLAADGVVPLAEAWGLVSERPAAAVGLDDRGRIAEGGCADLLLVDPGRQGLDALRWVWRGGRVVAVFS